MKNAIGHCLVLSKKEVTGLYTMVHHIIKILLRLDCYLERTFVIHFAYSLETYILYVFK